MTKAERIQALAAGQDLLTVYWPAGSHPDRKSQLFEFKEVAGSRRKVAAFSSPDRAIEWLNNRAGG